MVKVRDITGLLAIVPAMALLPLTVHGAANLPVFNQWSVDNGEIAGPGGVGVPCGVGFTCEVVSFGDGFAQVQWVTNGGGPTYIQTIITDLGATNPNPANLNYSDESFVRLGSDNGILSQQRHVQDDALGLFENVSSLQIGWANPDPSAESPHMSIMQSFGTQGTVVSGDEFNTEFRMLIVHNDQGEIQDRSIAIDQRAGLGDGVNQTDDLQRFLLIRNEGVFTTDEGTITLGATSFDGVGNPLNGGTVAWAAGDDVMVRWIGQSIDLDSQGMSQFGFQGVSNFSANPEQDVTTFSSTATGIDDGEGGTVFPFGWNDVFGPAPSLQDIQ